MAGENMIKQIYELKSFQPFVDMLKEDYHFSDPHFTYSQNTLYDALERENRHVFAVFNEEKVIGLFVFLIIPENQYIEMLIGFSKEEEAYEEIICKLQSEYHGFQMDFVYNPGNTAIQNVLTRLGAAFDTEQMKMTAHEPNIYDSKNNVQQFEEKYREQYCMMHTKDTYWTAERVLNATDRFKVFVAIENQEVVGYLDVTFCFNENEIYSIKVKEDYEGKAIEADLLRESLKTNLPKTMLVVIDVDDMKEIALFEMVGFKKVEGQNSITATLKG